MNIGLSLRLINLTKAGMFLIFLILFVCMTRGMLNNNIPEPTTIKEAQLIGRGARYCPFKLDNSDDPSKRKFDHDLQNEMRICEELYYHSNYNPRYIQELYSALIKTGIIPDNTVKKNLIIKNDFKNTEFYKSGLLFLNQPERCSQKDVSELPS